MEDIDQQRRCRPLGHRRRLDAELRQPAQRGGQAAARSGGQTFAGQADDPFFLDLRIFDLLYGGNLSEAGHDTLSGYNVNTLALQVPKADLAYKGDPTRNPVVGIWSTTAERSVNMSTLGNSSTGSYVQVSRLGNPLVNEAVVPLAYKDAFNSIAPNNDRYVTPVVNAVLHPIVPALIQSIYGIPAPTGPRDDLAEIFLTGIAKNAPTLDGTKAPIQADLNSPILNKDQDPKKFVPSEELRLNMAVPVTASPNRLGVIGGDLQGFPNGRRLGDDVVDIALQALEGAATKGIVPAAGCRRRRQHQRPRVRHDVPLRRAAEHRGREHPEVGSTRIDTWYGSRAGGPVPPGQCPERWMSRR